MFALKAYYVYLQDRTHFALYSGERPKNPNQYLLVQAWVENAESLSFVEEETQGHLGW
jgi:hypothetical protein